MRTLVSLTVVFLIGCGGKSRPAILPTDIVGRETDQVIMVLRCGEKPYAVSVLAHQRGPDGAFQLFLSAPGVIGPNGFAPEGEKREGDGRTPSGTFRMRTAFGHEPKIETKLDYRRATADDFWVDDPDSPQYNRWVHGKPEAKSFEKLRIDSYKYAAVVEYNTDPVVPGKGSAIFLHIWKGPDQPTAGCVALDEANVRQLITWLDRQKKPVIILNP
jgi:L,D-peptidoglycan transpeptidase YkuD (ErfK/YbiS/YcfS/YnhG family)